MSMINTRSIAATICSGSVAIGAYASHAAVAQEQHRLAQAALFAFAHSLALIVMAERRGGIARAARGCLFGGIALFSGGLAAAALLGTGTMTAPAGGMLFILGWLLAAIDYSRTP